MTEDKYIKVKNEFDDTNYVDSLKLASFLNDQNVKITPIQNFFCSKEKLFYVGTRKFLSDLAPFFIFNKSSINELLFLAGQKVKNKVNGIFLTKSPLNQKENLYEDLKEKFKNFPGFDDINLEVGRESDFLTGYKSFELKISYQKMEYVAFKLGFTNTSHIVCLKCIEVNNNKVIILIENTLATDYDNCLRLFKNEIFNDLYTINKFDFNEIQLGRNKIISESINISSLPIKLRLPKLNEKLEFKPLGIIKHKVENENTQESNDRLPNIITGGINHNKLIPLNDFVKLFETDYPEGLIDKIYQVYISKDYKYLVLFDFRFDSKFELGLHSLRELETNQQLIDFVNEIYEVDETEEIDDGDVERELEIKVFDLNYKEFGNLRSVLLHKEDNMKLLETFWFKSALEIMENFR